MGKLPATCKEISKILKKISPDLEELQALLDKLDDSTGCVIEDNIRQGTSNLLIAKRILKDKKK